MERFYEFRAGKRGPWRIDRIVSIAGDPLPAASHLSVDPISLSDGRASAAFSVRGVRSNERYTSTAERSSLTQRQAGLDRPEATVAVLIPITKSADWWGMAQDERRHVLEEQSRHIAIGAEYLPAVARRLYHCRDLGEPFDFLTWFEFAPDHAAAFQSLLQRLRATPEWTYVAREVEIHLTRDT